MSTRWESQPFITEGGSTELGAGVTSRARIVSRFEDKTVQIEGTLSGATVTIEGRIGTTWVAIETTVGLGLYNITESVRELRIIVNGGDGSTAVQASYAGFDSRSS